MSLYKVRQFNNFPQLIELSVSLFGESVAFSQKRQDGEITTLTYSQFRNKVVSFGTALCQMGYKSENIAICAGNCINWCIAYMAVSIYCNCVVPIDKELPSDDIISTVITSGTKLIITDKKTYEKLSDLSGVNVIGLDFENDNIKHIDTFFNNISVDAIPEKALGSPSVMLFTSGTTGKSKAVILSQENICFDISSVMKIVKINHGEKILSLLPLHHTYECSITFLCCFYAGLNICFGNGIRDIYKDLKLFSPDILVLVPLILKGVYSKLKKASEIPLEILKEKVKEFLGGRLRLIVCGAAPIEPEILKGISQFVPTVIQGYGLTECSPIAICNSDYNAEICSVGKPLPGTQAKIINSDENGNGEICVKGPMVMLGYFDGKEITSPLDNDGWFHTGDLGKCDKQGNYYITGRLKNVIITPNGKNIYPEELEAQLNRYEEITESLVFEGTDNRGSSAVCVKIVSDADFETVKKIVYEVNSKNAPYKAIKKIELLNELPKNTSFKILRNK